MAILKKRRLGSTHMVVTELSLGGVGIGGLYGPVPEAAAAGAVRRALDLGINYIDTSPLYKESEERLGRVFQALGGKPDDLFLSTKMGTHPARRGDYSAEATRWSVENSLKLLQVDYVDCLLVHDPGSPAQLQQALGPGGAFEELARLKVEGKVKSVGLGVREHHYHREAIAHKAVDIILTYADYTLIRQTASSLIAEAAAAGVGVLMGQALVAGLLAGPDPSLDERLQGHRDLPAARDWQQWATSRGVSLQALAIQFCLRNPNIGCVLVGAKTASEVEQNVEAATVNIPEHIWREVEERIRTGVGQAK